MLFFWRSIEILLDKESCEAAPLKTRMEKDLIIMYNMGPLRKINFVNWVEYGTF